MIEEYQLTQTLDLAKCLMMESVQLERDGDVAEAEGKRSSAIYHLTHWAHLAVQYEQEQYE